MYLSMLKRDLKDQKGLNAVLFVFMIVASVAMVTGVTLLYSMLKGEDLTYDKCNTSDVVALAPVNISDPEGVRADVIDEFNSWDITTDVSLRQVVSIPDTSLIVYGTDGARVDSASESYVITSMPSENNIPYTQSGERFEVPNGCVAISQMTSSLMGLKAGDSLRLVTQLGNVYEFEICQIYVDPVETAADFMILSDRDTEIFYSECPVKYDLYEVHVDVGDADYVEALRPLGEDLLFKFQDYGMKMNAAKTVLMNDEALMVIIIIVAVTLVAFFVMAMILMTIDFSIKSTVKRETKQIGMMKAIGVWSFSYKTLFVVKYAVFGIICGLLGLPLGYLLSMKIYESFVYNILFPDFSSMIAIGSLAMAVNILFIFLFCLISLRRMNKISVIDAIHGENRGERFARLSGLSLARSKKIRVASFLAVSDILRAIKRYIYLVIAYTLGIAAVLFMVQLKDSILDISYIQHYFQRGTLDFNLVLSDTYRERLLQGKGSYEAMYDYINQIFEENDIPARIVLTHSSNAEVYFNGNSQVANISWQDADITDLDYLPGGDAPRYYNEVAISWYHANEWGIDIGDTITIEYYRYSDDHTSYSEVSEEFLVTGFFDYYGHNAMKIIMSREFNGAVLSPDAIFSTVIDAPEREFDDILARMRSLWPEDQVTVSDRQGVIDDILTGYDLIFNMMIAVTAFAAASVLILLTALYENIFIEEETSDIALLKSMGFNRNVIRGWHIIRLMILGMTSMLLALLFNATVGNKMIELLFTSLLSACSFRFSVDPVHNFVIIPLCVITGLAVVVTLMTRLTDNIQIWKVRTE
ncbi:MAG: hypothetical protein J6127_00655 [Clostridiales bacterium]|nr:hypothetical protein [Clostridiales bacterium]